mgnify:CR=1 FL=1
MQKNNGKYDDIINLPHHISKKYPRMSLEARSAQFAPFSALTGYEEVIRETSRVTNKRIEINEELKAVLNEKLLLIKSRISTRPIITVTYFIPDSKKNGGRYITVIGNVLKIDEYKQKIFLENKIEIPISEIIEIIDALWYYMHK